MVKRWMMAVLAVAVGVIPCLAAEQLSTGSVSGLPLPRFVSVKSEKVNVRTGPSLEHAPAWSFARAGVPVEVTAEFDNWRRIRDWEGAEGWVFHSMLSGKRMALVEPKARSAIVNVYGQKNASTPLVAKLQAGVIATLKSCEGQWCHLVGEKFEGWVEQKHLWGAYPEEKFE